MSQEASSGLTRTTAGRAVTSQAGVPVGFAVALDPGTGFWAGGRVATGGAPWRVVRFKEAAEPYLAELRRSGSAGVAFTSVAGRVLVRRLLDQGFVHPVPGVRSGPHEVTVVVPAFGRADELERCLTAVKGVPVIVVDDGSPEPETLRRVARAHGARLVRHEVNRGPAAARNTGLRLAETPFVAFVDCDCRPEEGWLDVLMPHFDDPKVAAVAPRIVPEEGGRGALARYEAVRSALDMGPRPALVRPGAKLGFVPTATLIVRKESLSLHKEPPGVHKKPLVVHKEPPGIRKESLSVRKESPGDKEPPGDKESLGDLVFDEELRLGEDVDFVWRLADRGLNVRYQPEARVTHTPRLEPWAWARRRHEYGTSAAALAELHPGRLAPARLSAWNLVTLGGLALGRPLPAAASAALTTVLLDRGLRGIPGHGTLSASIVGKGIVADAAAIGHALRREWWPLGLLCLATSGRSRLARGAATAMLAPLALEWLTRRPALDPIRYTALRLAEDLAYGSGVTASAWRHRSPTPLLPTLRLPRPGKPHNSTNKHHIAGRGSQAEGNPGLGLRPAVCECCRSSRTACSSAGRRGRVS